MGSRARKFLQLIIGASIVNPTPIVLELMERCIVAEGWWDLERENFFS